MLPILHIRTGGSVYQLLYEKDKEMKIKDAQKIIDFHASRILFENNYVKKGKLDEYIRTNEYGNNYAVLIDLIKQSKTYALNIHIYVAYKEIEELFPDENNQFPYTFTTIISSFSCPIDEIGSEECILTLKEKLNNDAFVFIEKYKKSVDIYNNITSSNFSEHEISDPIAKFKIKLASSISSNGYDKTKELISEIIEYNKKPYSIPYRSQLENILLCTQKHI